MKYQPPNLEAKKKINHNAPEESITKKSLQLIFSFIFLFFSFLVLINFSIRGVAYFAPIDFAKEYRDDYINGLIAEKSGEALARQEKIEEIFAKLHDNVAEDVDLKVYVAEDEDFVNAIATPTGAIIIGKGLLEYLNSEQEIAMILGHEIGHQINRDTVSGLANAITLSVVLSVFSGGEFASNIIFSLTNLTSLKFSRDAEYAADKYGLKLLRKTYGSSEGSIEAYQNLIKAMSEQGVAESGFDLFNTHPDTKKRIAIIEEMNK